ncbi:PREDICTED: uncharacterized protein LOC109463477 [Branchiostoma belcheri]|uniref:Uncharacterized protein LOC109463477 n=1 Tax=Branchiostoma belcheri TaxID=7741 RepID=A0A6P4XUW0_BRABE|nr:PREDICTED: uncharacterized protein LOC109463477 [Branchiostoma belcheri]
MAGGLLRVLVLLCAAAAVARAQVWYSHGKPSGTWISTAMAPLTHFEGKKWFGVGANGYLYERYENPSGTWLWVNHGRPSSGRYNSACSNVHKLTPALKARTFVVGSNRHLYERFWEWGTPGSWTWRWHGRPPSTHVASIKTTSYIITPSGYSFVFVVGTNGNVYRRLTHQNGGGSWYNVGRPAGKIVRRIHATHNGYLWAVTTDGSVCRWQGGWPCFSLTNRKILDCSDPFFVSSGRSMFCITQTGIIQGSSGYGLYQLTVSGSPPTATWVNHGVPTMPFYYSFVDRPNVVFTGGSGFYNFGETPKRVFVSSTIGVFELRL